MPELEHRLSSDRAAVVSDGYHWRPIDDNTPRGRKLQLINRRAGVACYGRIESSSSFWTHWAPMPTFKEQQ